MCLKLIQISFIIILIILNYTNSLSVNYWNTSEVNEYVETIHKKFEDKLKMNPKDRGLFSSEEKVKLIQQLLLELKNELNLLKMDQWILPTYDEFSIMNHAVTTLNPEDPGVKYINIYCVNSELIARIGKLKRLREEIEDEVPKRWTNYCRLVNTWLFAAWDSIIRVIDKIYSTSFSNSFDMNSNCLKFYSKYLSANEYNFCNQPISIQRQMFQLYNSIVYSHTYGSVLVMYLWYAHSICQNSDFTGELNQTKAKFIRNSEDYVNLTKVVFNNVSRSLYSCELKNYKKDETYAEMEGLLERRSVPQESDNPQVAALMNPKLMKTNSKTITFSFREATSDIANNKIVVGVKFVKKNNIIHLQVKEGEALGTGKVRSEQWKELENIYYDNMTMKMWDVDKGSERVLTYQKDYGFAGSVCLDDISAPENYVVTGVKMQPVETNLADFYYPIELQVRVTPFDYITGKLIDKNLTQWISAGVERKQLVIENPRNPVNSSGNKPISINHQFVTFTIGSDASAVVPLIDLQQIESHFPLNGVGFYLLGRSDNGGFLSLKLFTYDLFQYFDANNVQNLDRL